MKDIELRVAGNSYPPSVAGSAVKNMQEGKGVTLSAIGAGAVNQMVKACAIAVGMAKEHGMDLVFVPSFQKEILNGSEITSLSVRVLDINSEKP